MGEACLNPGGTATLGSGPELRAVGFRFSRGLRDEGVTLIPALDRKP